MLLLKPVFVFSHQLQFPSGESCTPFFSVSFSRHVSLEVVLISFLKYTISNHLLTIQSCRKNHRSLVRTRHGHYRESWLFRTSRAKLYHKEVKLLLDTLTRSLPQKWIFQESFSSTVSAEEPTSRVHYIRYIIHFARV